MPYAPEFPENPRLSYLHPARILLYYEYLYAVPARAADVSGNPVMKAWCSMNDMFEEHSATQTGSRPDTPPPAAPAPSVYPPSGYAPVGAVPPAAGYAAQPPYPPYGEARANPYGNGAPNLFEERQPYRGGVPVRCPRCGNVVATPVCGFCGTDLSKVYTVAGMAPPPTGCYNAYPGCRPPQPPAAYYPPPAPVYPAQGYGYAAAAYPTVQKRPNHRTAWIAGGLALLFIAVFVGCVFLFRGMLNSPPADNSIIGINPGNGGFTTPSTPQDYYIPYGVSPEEYAQLKVGMSYALISQIIGGDGQLMEPTNQDEVLESEYVVYGWPGELDPNAALYITFVEGRATEITAKGLDK